MSPNFELLDKWDVKETPFSKVEMRNCVNDMYRQVDVLRGAMKAQLDCEEFFGEYFEQFETEYTNLLAVVGFLHEVHMMNDGVHKGVLWKLDEILQEVLQMYKQVYSDVDE